MLCVFQRIQVYLERQSNERTRKDSENTSGMGWVLEVTGNSKNHKIDQSFTLGT